MRWYEVFERVQIHGEGRGRYVRTGKPGKCSWKLDKRNEKESCIGGLNRQSQGWGMSRKSSVNYKAEAHHYVAACTLQARYTGALLRETIKIDKRKTKIINRFSHIYFIALLKAKLKPPGEIYGYEFMPYQSESFWNLWLSLFESSQKLINEDFLPSQRSSQNESWIKSTKSMTTRRRKQCMESDFLWLLKIINSPFFYLRGWPRCCKKMKVYI